MARLSNFLRRHDASAGRGLPAHSTLECRLVRREEIDHSLRLLLAGPGGLASNEQVLDFLSFAIHRGVDVNSIWVASRGGRVEWALLPVPSPGRTMLVLSPTQLLPRTPPETLVALISAVCSDYASRGVHLAQLLLDPNDSTVASIYATVGFQELAELVYLNRKIRSARQAVELPIGCELKPYNVEVDAQFAATIVASYEGSLDCPGLNGMRDVRDVLEGHKGSGDFEPTLWEILLEHGQPRAVLLLNRAIGNEAMELVYLGLVPSARGRGLGDLMMRVAIDRTARDGKSALSLAVDSRNAPALNLYFRHGMQRVGARTAMLRDLRLPAQPSPDGSRSI